MAMAPFLWGDGGRPVTRASLKSQREVAAALAASGQNPKTLWEGLQNFTGQIGGTLVDNAANDAEKQAQDAYGSQFSALGENPTMSDLEGIAGNEFGNDTQNAVVQALLGKRLDPYGEQMKALQLKQAQLNYDQDASGADTGGGYFGATLPFQDAAGNINYYQLRKDEPPVLPEGAHWLEPTSTVNTGTAQTVLGKNSGGVLNSIPIDNAGAARDTTIGKGFGEIDMNTIEAGQNAANNNVKLDALEASLANAPQGAQGGITQLAGAIGLNIGGLDEVQASEAIINSLVPLQRAPGSGTMSDADLELFKKSLPRIINQPGGNARIINTLRALNNYTIAHAAIVRKLALGQIDQAQADSERAAIPNPLSAINAQGGGSAGSTKYPGVTIKKVSP